MAKSSYYQDAKYCTDCDTYVPYLMSASHSYCTQCGSRVKLFSDEDWSVFNASIQPKKHKGGRPRNKRSTA